MERKSAALRVAVIGAGWFASRRHLPDLLQLLDVEVVAACRRGREALDCFCDHFHIQGRYTDYQEMLEETSPDAVVICSPHSCHYEQVRECLERQIHVLVEKPLALTTAEAQDLRRRAEERSLALVVALNPPYWRHCHLAREWIAQGRIGQLEAVEIAWMNCAAGFFGKEPMPEKLPGVVRPTSFRCDPALGGGGHLMDGGQHNVSELLWVTGDSAGEVSAAMDQLPVDLRTSVSVCLSGGAIASILGMADSRIGVRRAHSAYYGSEGTLRIDVLPFRLTLERPDGSRETMEESEMPPAPTPVADLVHCIRTGATPLGSASHAIETTRVIEAAYLSAGRGDRL